MARRGHHHFMVVPDEDAGPIQRATVRRVAATFRPYRGRVALVAAIIVVTATLGVVNPLLITVVFDRALFPTANGRVLQPNMHLLVFYVGLMIVVPVVSASLGVGQTYLANLLGQRVMQDLRDGLYRHLQSMSLRFFTSTRTGEIQSRLSNDVGGVQEVVTNTASSILSNIVIVASTIIAMLALNVWLTILSLGLLPFFLWFTYRVGKARQQVARHTQESMAELTAITQETLSVSGVLLSKVFGRQDDEIRRFRSENRRLADLEIRQQMVGRYFFAVINIFFSITPALVYLVAGYVINGAWPNPVIKAGVIVAFTTLQSRLFFPVGQLLQIQVQMQSSMALFERIFEYLDLPRDIVDPPDAIELPRERVQGRIRFRDVSFRYDRAQLLADGAAVGVVPSDAGAVGGDGAAVDGESRTWALRGVDLEIQPGQLAALVGPSGAGKTTITYLVPRLYDVDEGAVEIDGEDTRDLRMRSLADAIGMVTQETYLFHATIRENLLYGRPDATQPDLEAAARAAFIHDRIAEMPDGYDTVVGERGYRLSGGEKQRLAIARVILKDPRILILDEATSNLDTASERMVQAALRPLMRGRTTLAIAHRLSTILSADVIFVLDRGRIVERGTHAELIRVGGLYARLYEQQFDGVGDALGAEGEDGLLLTDGGIAPRPAAS